MVANFTQQSLINSLNKAKCQYADLVSQQINRVFNLDKESCEINDDIIRLQAVIYILSNHVVGGENNCLSDTQVYQISQIPNSIDCCSVGSGNDDGGDSGGGGGGGGGFAGAYVLVADEGVVLPQQIILNFIGNQVVVTDDPLNTRTDVTIYVEGENVFNP